MLCTIVLSSNNMRITSIIPEILLARIVLLNLLHLHKCFHVALIPTPSQRVRLFATPLGYACNDFGLLFTIFSSTYM